MALYERNNSTNKYPLFKEIFKDLSTSSVLDYGGNRGNLLYFSNGEIIENTYTSIDVDIESIESGKQEFPNANWYHYDKFNYMYNHNGQTTEFPRIENKNQDLIWAYSVFSHTDLEELKYTLKWLTSFNFKKLAVSVLDINTSEVLQYFYTRRVKDYGYSFKLPDLKGKDYDIVYFFDHDSLIINREVCPKLTCQHFVSFYNLDFLQDYLKQHGYTTTIKRPGDGYFPFLYIEN